MKEKEKKSKGDQDFLDEIEAAWTAKDSEFPRLVREAEARQNWRRKVARKAMSKQCPAGYTGRNKSRGAFTTVFCLKQRGHKGDHRGDRTQWTQDGRKVPITEPSPTQR
jgi:hypothetical protein